MRVTFIRHSACEWSGRNVLHGHTDVPLSNTGRLQARLVAERLQDRAFDALWSSPLARARDTAAAIGDAIGHAAILDPRLSEIDLGQFEGAPFSALSAGPGTFRDRWQKRPATVRFPGGENLNEVARRVWTVLDELYDRHPNGHVAIVSHMFAISSALCRILNVRVGRFRTFGVDLASISTVQMDGHGFRLLLLNDTAHLSSLDGSDLPSSVTLPVRKPLRGGTEAP